MAARLIVSALVAVACAKATPVTPTPTPTPGPEAVWIDMDPAVGVPDRDVDDGVALLQALASPELTVVGTSTVFGNAPLEQADPIARTLVADWSPGLPVHRGAATASRTPTPASDALIAALEVQPLTLLVLGPATNVATVLTARPDLADRVRHVVAVAGRRPGQRFTTGTTNPAGHRDFNFEQDPDAFRVLLDAEVPLTLAGFPVSRHVWLHTEHLDALQDAPRAHRLVGPARRWLDLWARVFDVDGFNPFDTLAVGVLVTPELLSCPPGRARIVQGPDDRTEEAMQGDDVETKPYLVVDDGPGVPVAMCDDVQADAFLGDLLGRLAR